MATAILAHPRVLHSEAEYDAAVAEIHRLLDANPKKGSREHDALELLSLLVEDYETRTIPEPPAPTPQSIVAFMLEQKGLTRADLVEPLGSRSRVSEFFTGKRPLSTNQIKALRDLLGISADLLLEAAAEPAAYRAGQVVSLQFHGERPEKKKTFVGSHTVRAKQRVAKSNPRAVVTGKFTTVQKPLKSTRKLAAAAKKK